MSANIYWRPIPIKGNDISTRAPSHFIEMSTIDWLQEILLEHHWNNINVEKSYKNVVTKVYKQHLPILRGMSIASSADTRDALNEIIKAIQNYEQIEVWAEY